MEVSSGLSPRGNHNDSKLKHFEIESDHSVQHDQNHGHLQLEHFEIEADHSIRQDHQFRSTSALEILNEVIRILRYNLTGFTCIAALLICPLSAILLSNVLLNQSLVKKLNLKLMLIAQSCGLPLKPFIKQLCHKFSEMTISSIMCFPLSITLSLLSKSAIIHSVDCTYAKKIFDSSKFYAFFAEIWRRLICTFLYKCVVLAGSSMLLIVFVAILSRLLSEIGLVPDLIIYPVTILSLVFCVVFVSAVLICNVAIVISVVEDASGLEAVLRSRVLIKGQTQLGISLILGSTLCMAIVEGLFDHRVKTVSYGDGSSRLWEGPLLVVMYAFVLLIDQMVTTVFYVSCKAYRTDGADEERQPVLR